MLLIGRCIVILTNCLTCAAVISNQTKTCANRRLSSNEAFLLQLKILATVFQDLRCEVRTVRTFKNSCTVRTYKPGLKDTTTRLVDFKNPRQKPRLQNVLIFTRVVFSILNSSSICKKNFRDYEYAIKKETEACRKACLHVLQQE